MKNLCSSLLVIVVAISGAIGKKISENPPIPILINPAHHVFQPRYEPFQPLQKLLDLENGKYKINIYANGSFEAFTNL